METISNKPSYTIVPITEKDVERVVNFLRKFFFRDEPLNVAVGLLDEPNSTCRELEEYCVDCVPEGKQLNYYSKFRDIGLQPDEHVKDN